MRFLVSFGTARYKERKIVCITENETVAPTMEEIFLIIAAYLSCVCLSKYVCWISLEIFDVR